MAFSTVLVIILVLLTMFTSACKDQATDLSIQLPRGRAHGLIGQRVPDTTFSLIGLMLEGQRTVAIVLDNRGLIGTGRNDNYSFGGSQQAYDGTLPSQAKRNTLKLAVHRDSKATGFTLNLNGTSADYAFGELPMLQLDSNGVLLIAKIISFELVVNRDSRIANLSDLQDYLLAEK